MPRYTREQPDLLTRRNGLIEEKDRLWRRAFGKIGMHQFNQVTKEVLVIKEELLQINRIIKVGHERVIG